MCGIAGLFSQNKESINIRLVDSMLNRIHHRGPDDRGLYCLGRNGEGISAYDSTGINLDSVYLAMGFNRLCIRDLSANGHQPMLSADKQIVLTFNGEIYNIDELIQNYSINRSELVGKSDTEVILRAYEIDGEKIFRYLNGMFAIVLLDLRIRKLIIVRDKVGIIPIYIYHENDLISWASEEKAFLAIPEFKRELDIKAASTAFMYYNPPGLLHKNLTNVEPGMMYIIDIDSGELFKNKYFSIDEWFGNNYFKNECEAIDAYESVLADCVKRQMITDVPLGLQLSGGIDSTSIAYWASKYCARPINSFSTINLLSEDFNEQKWIDYVVRSITVNPSYVYVDDDFFIRNFEKTLYAFEKILGVQDGMSILSFSYMASKSITVLLSGEGADEICGGYGLISGMIDGSFSFSDEFLIGFDKQINLLENGFAMINEFEFDDHREKREKYLNSLCGTDIQKMEALWLKEELVNLLERQNKINMANSVENRVPFLDDEMLKFMFALPSKYIFNFVDDYGNQSKYIMKRAAEKYYGKEFAYRPKQACRFRISDQIKSMRFNEYLHDQIIPGMKKRGIINTTEFCRRYRLMKTGQDVLAVWKAINLEAWCQLFIDAREIIC